jgi:hypothetical protein
VAQKAHTLTYTFGKDDTKTISIPSRPGIEIVIARVSSNVAQMTFKTNNVLPKTIAVKDPGAERQAPWLLQALTL